jgi:hypothetical protein
MSLMALADGADNEMTIEDQHVGIIHAASPKKYLAYRAHKPLNAVAARHRAQCSREYGGD